MYAIDFEYDGQYLSDYGFIICDFNGTYGIAEASAGSVITFNKVQRDKGKKYSLSSTQYSECVSATFDICKNDEFWERDQLEITNDEYRDLMRWLNRREFLSFQLVDDTDEYETKESCFYDASFNIEKILINSKLYGLRLKMETDKPFGYGQEQRVSWNFTDTGSPKNLSNISDEIGSLYPTLIVTCMRNGDLSIHNELEGCTTVIKNCQVGEVITIHGDTQIITSSFLAHDICSDFNYDFFRIGNTIKTRSNMISVSMPCKLEIRYRPIIKDSP